MTQKLKPRKVTEIKSRLNWQIPRRVFIVNQTKNASLIIEEAEAMDGTKPKLLVRIKAVFIKKTRRRKSRKL